MPVFAPFLHFIHCLIIGLVCFLLSCRQLKTEAPETAVESRPPISSTTSYISIPVQIDLRSSLKEVEAMVPKKMHGEQQLCEGVSYAYTVHRSPISFKGSGSEMTYDVKAEYALRLNYCPACTELFDDEGTCIIPRVYASCGINEAMRKMEIGYTSQISLTENWQFKSVTRLQKVRPLDPCRVTFVQYDATDHLVQEVRKELKALEKQIDQSISSTNLRRYVEPAWKELSSAFPMNGYGNLYLFPKSLSVDNLYFKDQQAHFRLHLEVHPRVVFEDLPVQPLPLPSNTKSRDQEGFDLELDIEATYDSLSEVLNRELRGTALELNGKQVIFEDIRIQGASNQGINLAVRISGKKKGTLYFTGTPVYDAIKQELTVPDLTFDVKTRNALLKSAKWLFNDRIERQLRSAAKFDLKPHLEKLKVTLEHQLQVELPNGIKMNGYLNQLQLIHVFPGSDQLFFRIRMIGGLGLQL